MSININDEPDAEERRRQILALRSISSILSIVPHRNPKIQPSDNLDKLAKNNVELIKICDALAQVLVIEHEVIAVASDHRYELLEGGVLRIVSCSGQESNEQQSTPGGTIMSFMIKFMLTYNPTEPPNASKSSRFALPSFKPSGISTDITKATVLQHLQTVPDHKTTPTLPEYLWVITQALVTKPPEDSLKKEQDAHRDDLSQALMMYVCAVCHKKMRRRFLNADLSQPYFQALQNVNMTGLPPLAPNSFPDKEDPDTFVKMSSDRLFLEEYIIKLDGQNVITTDITELIKKAKEVLSRGEEEGCYMYTNATRLQFHNLLVEILTDFGRGLDVLSVHQPGSTGFKDGLKLLYRSAYLLLRLSRGLAFQVHVNSIFSRLTLALNLPEMRSANDPESDPEINYIRNLVLPKSFIAWARLMVGHLDSIEVLHRFTNSPAFTVTEISASFMVVEEPDTEVLPWRNLFDENYIPEPEFAKEDGAKVDGAREDSEQEESNIYDSDKYDSDKYDSDKEDDNKKKKSDEMNITNDMIRRFFDSKTKDSIFAKSVLINSQNLYKHLTPSIHAIYAPRWVKNIKTAIDSRTAELKAQMEAIDEAIKAKTITANDADFRRDLLNASNTIVQSVHPTFVTVENKVKANDNDAAKTVSDWIVTQTNANAALHFYYCMETKKVLQGTIHCEAYLASLLPLHLPSSRPSLLGVSENLRPFQGQEIGVSKRCCPVCLSYLEIIQGRDAATKFLVSGSHEYISETTLPPWTALEHLKAMNTHWGKILREDFLTMMAADPSVKRHRTRTTGSMGRSSDQSLSKAVSAQSHPRQNNLMDTFIPS